MRNDFFELDAASHNLQKFDSADNTAITLTKAADEDQFWGADWVTWSYDDEPTGGRLTITIGSLVVVDIDIISGGPGILRFDPPLYVGTKGEALVAVLAAGGSGVAGKLSLRVR